MRFRLLELVGLKHRFDELGLSLHQLVEHVIGVFTVQLRVEDGTFLEIDCCLTVVY